MRTRVRTSVRRRRRGFRSLLRGFRRRILLALLILLLVFVGIWSAFLPSAGGRSVELLWQASRAVESQQFDEAKDLAGEYLGMDPESPRANFLLGAALFGLGEKSAGMDRMKAALELDPSMTGAQLHLGEIFARENRYAEALVHLDAAPEAQARVMAAEILTTLGRLEDASANYSRAISRGRREIPLLLAALELHRLLADRGHRGAAVHREKWEQVRNLARDEVLLTLDDLPEDPEATATLALLLDQDARSSPEEVERAFIRALQADPGNAKCRASYADFLIRNGRVASARRILEEGVGEHGTPAACLALAGFLAESCEFGALIELLDEVASRWPDDPGVLASRAEALGRAGMSNLAREAVRAALLKFPDEIRLLEVGGDLAGAAGELDRADQLYGRALGAEPRNLRVLRKRVALRMEDLLGAGGSRSELPEHLKRTESLLRELVDLNRWDRAGLLWRADLARVRGRSELALNLLAELLKVHPDEGAARSMRGRILKERHDDEGAMEEFLVVVKSGSAGPDDYLLFVEAALAAGRPAAVVRIAERGLRKWPENVELLKHLGEAHLQLERGRDFLRQVEKQPESVREDPGVERLTAWAEVQAGREKQAERRLRRLLDAGRLTPGEFARFLYAVDRGDEAEAFLREAADRNSGSNNSD